MRKNEISTFSRVLLISFVFGIFIREIAPSLYKNCNFIFTRRSYDNIPLGPTSKVNDGVIIFFFFLFVRLNSEIENQASVVHLKHSKYCLFLSGEKKKKNVCFNSKDRKSIHGDQLTVRHKLSRKVLTLFGLFFFRQFKKHAALRPLFVVTIICWRSPRPPAFDFQIA